jgi:hypothetical protein
VVAEAASDTARATTLEYAALREVDTANGHLRTRQMNRRASPKPVVRGAMTIAVVGFMTVVTSCGPGATRPSVGGSGVLTASHVSSRTAGSKAGASPGHTVIGNATQSWTYPGFQATLDPPGNARPTLTASDAVALCGEEGSGVSCEPGRPASIELGHLTDAGMGINQRLVWAMSWDAVNCQVYGPAGRPTSGSHVNDATGCNFVSFVDATSGANPMAILRAGI